MEAAGMDRGRDVVESVGEAFVTEVFPEELAAIRGAEADVPSAAPAGLLGACGRRLRRFFAAPDDRPPRGRVLPSTRHGLAGVALSGGGIRSATFNLGVLQALAKLGVLRRADYLSTVSGGGYVGGCLGSLLATGADTAWDPETFPFYHEMGTEESTVVRHLRNSGSWLAPGGRLAVLKIPALLLFGALADFLILFPWIALAVMGTECVYRLRGELWVRMAYELLPAAVVGGLVMTLVSVLIVRACAPRMGWAGREALERVVATALLVLVAFAVLRLTPGLIRAYDALLGWSPTASDLAAAAAAAAFVASPLFAAVAARNVGRAAGRVALYLLGALGPLVLLVVYLRLCAWTLFGRAPAWLPASVGADPYTWIYLSGTWPLMLFAWLFVNPNATSLHGFYRDRLSRAYLMRWRKTAGRPVSPNDAQRLSGLAAGAGRPYHLLNAAVNLTGSEDPSLRGRGADFFVFAKGHCGSRRTGYCRTERLESLDGHFDLGTAMAVSGAAAAPNMGSCTIKPLVFVMALLNIRLGYWLPNPAQRAVPGWRRPRLGPFFFLRELLGRIDERSPFVNVSDGGYLENLGVYELLRRRCRLIVASDAGADPAHAFSDLARVLTYARIDLGAVIDIDLEALRPDAAGRCRRHAAVGRIDYGGGETGTLVYVKASVTGDENEFLRGYRVAHPAFPHESTTDQFFDEAQFEAYRYLGYHAVTKAAGRVDEARTPAVDDAGQEPLAAWEEALAKALA
jgi:hypothetical protein